MSAVPGPAVGRIPRAATANAGGWANAALPLAALGGLVIARLAATRAGLDPVLIGATFGLGLVGLFAAGGGRVGTSPAVWRNALVGAVFGLALVAVVLLGSLLAGQTRIPGLARPAGALAPWAAATVLVAIAEEAVLRGLLFDRVRRAGGALLAVGVTTLSFALLHVPLYGWQVVPLDLAVGLALGGLRIATRGIAAPAAAHVVADLATWWL